MRVSLAAFLPVLFSLSVPTCAQVTQTASPVGSAVTGRFLVVYSDGSIPADAEARTGMAGGRLLKRNSRLGIAVVQAGLAGTAVTAERLAAQPGVTRVVQDRIVSAHSMTVQDTNQHNAQAFLPPGGTSMSAESWAVRQVGGFGDSSTPGPWSTTRGAGVRIAILDSGVDTVHPDLAPNLALNLSEIDPTALPSPCDDGSPQDQQGHGTWAASLAAGAGGQNGLGIGVAPAATLLNIKVLQRMPADGVHSSTCAAGEASGLLSWVLQGIDDAVANHADIISLSLGTLVDLTTGDGAGLKATFDQVTHAAANAGVIIIAAAGNDGLDLAGSRYAELPAQARDVLAIVASSNPACAENLAAGAACVPGPVTLPYYSNYGTPLNALAAPGGSYPEGPATDPTATSGWIYAACSQGKPATADGVPADSTHSFGCFGLGHTAYVQAMGTSASAPLTAGAVALLRAAHPEWSVATLLSALRASGTPVAGLPVPLVGVSALLTFSSRNANQHQAATQAAF